ncbi:MAG: transcription antitermination factor NusB [Clostridia bacterium]|nr:transcription antitermination factor NusB [Clostridia bacterium]
MDTQTSRRRASREQALRYLYEYEVQPDLTASAIVSSARSEREEEPTPYATLLFKTAIEHLEEIDRRIGEASKNWDFRRISRVSLAVLRLSAAEVLFLPSPPAVEIAVNEALELAKKYGTDESVPFINGILGALFAPKAGENA